VQTAEVDATELMIVLAAVIVGSTIKAVTGMGLPLIVIPVAAMFVSLEDAVVVIALPNVLANGTLAFRNRTHWGETRDLPVLLVTGIVGAVVGTLLFINIAEEPLVAALIVSIVVYVVLFVSNPQLRTPPDRSRRLAPAIGVVSGGFQGAIGISGSIVGTWIHSYRLERGAHILSVTALFLVSGATQLVLLIINGELSGRVLATLLACIPVLASIPLGTVLGRRVSRQAFDSIIIGILSLSAISLTIRTFL
jgi:uncharacterized membrane protein YfcA